MELPEPHILLPETSATKKVAGPSLAKAPIGQALGILFSQFVRGNYFYLLSAALMLWATYLLMPSQMVTGDSFAPKFKALLVLQGYEILLIGTAILIARRLRTMDDAFSLLLVELALLLDPTFFSNSFATLRGSHGMLVNASCFVAALVKSLVLVHGLRLRLHPLAWVSWAFALLHVYLLEGPLCQKSPFGLPDTARYFYLLSWAPFLFALLSPDRQRLFSVRSSMPEYLPPKRCRSLRHTLFWLPLGVIILHLLESSKVYDIEFGLSHLAPLVLAVAALLVRNIPRERLPRRMHWIDLCSLSALLLAGAGGGPFAAPSSAWRPVPLACTGAAVLGIHLWAYAKCRDRKTLYRVILVGAAGGGWLALRNGWMQMAFHFSVEALESLWYWVSAWRLWDALGVIFRWTEDLLSSLVAGIDSLGTWLWDVVLPGSLFWVGEHPWLVMWAAWALLGGLLWRFRIGFLWTCFGLLTLWNLFGLLPGRWEGHFLEMSQAMLAYLVVMDHVFRPKGDRGLRYGLAALAVGAGLLQYGDSPGSATIAVAVLEMLLLGFFGIRLLHAGYLALGILEAVVFTVLSVRIYEVSVDSSLVVLGCALGCFAIGVVITFYKRRITGWLDRFFPEAVFAGGPGLEAAGGSEGLAAIGRPRALHAPGSALPPPLPSPAEEPSDMPPLDSETMSFPERDALPPSEMGKFLEMLIITTPADGIFLWRDCPDEVRGKLNPDLAAVLGPDERVAVCVFFTSSLSTIPFLVLTSCRMIAWSHAGRPSIRYEQIGAVRTEHANLVLTGHLGQEMVLSGLSPEQRKLLWRSLKITQMVRLANFLRETIAESRSVGAE